MVTILTAAICGAAGLQASRPPAYITAKTFIAAGHTTGAAGNGATDDTDSLQQAINYAVNNGCSLYFEPGLYRIVRTLVVQAPAANLSPSGFSMKGIPGPNRTTSSTAGGAEIELDGSATNQSAVLNVGPGNFLDLSISNMGFVSRVSNNQTAFGVLFSSQQFSHAMLHNVQVGFVNTAYGVVNSPNSNGAGDRLDLDACMGNYVNTFYYNNSGPAYNHHIYGCNATIENGGTTFVLGNAGLGHSLEVDGFTSSFQTGTKTNTFFSNSGFSGNVNFRGGREELVDTVLSYVAGSATDAGMISFNGMQFTNLRNNGPVIANSSSSNLAEWTNTFVSCQFNAVPNTSPDVTFLGPQGDNTLNIFDKCVFRSVDKLIGGTNKFVDCRICTSTDKPLVDIPNN